MYCQEYASELSIRQECQRCLSTAGHPADDYPEPEYYSEANKTKNAISKTKKAYGRKDR